MRAKARAGLHARRDQETSAFAVILADLVARVPGARAAALVDFDGETVDYASCADPFEVRLAAAHLRIVLREVQGLYGDSCALSVRAASRSYLARALPQGYAVVLVLTCGALTASAGRAFPVCVQRLGVEAGWDPAPPPVWHPVEVGTDERGRPLGVSTEEGPSLEILGTIAGGLARFERGWRVRLSGGEATLIREPSGHWYIDEPHLARSLAPPR